MASRRSTSVIVASSSPFDMYNLVLIAFEQLAIAFKLKFDKAFDIKKEYKAKVKKSRQMVGSVNS